MMSRLRRHLILPDERRYCSLVGHGLRMAMGGGGAGGEVLVIWNPNDKAAEITLSDDKLSATCSASNKVVRATQGRTGKRYFEVVLDYSANVSIKMGVATSAHSVDMDLGQSSTSWALLTDGRKYHNQIAGTYGQAHRDGQIIGVAVDLDAGKIWWSIDNVWQASGDPAAGTGEAYSNLPTDGTLIYPAINLGDGAWQSGRFRTGELTYSPPAGFAAWDDAAATAGQHQTDFAGLPLDIHPEGYLNAFRSEDVWRVVTEDSARRVRADKTADSGGTRQGLYWIGRAAQDVEVLCAVKTDSFRNESTSSIHPGVFVRGTGMTASTMECYAATLRQSTSAMELQLAKYVSGTFSSIVTMNYSWTTGTYYWMRLRVAGSNLYAKVWADGEVEPADWMLTASDTSIPHSGWVGPYNFWKTIYHYKFLSVGLHGASAPTG